MRRLREGSVPRVWQQGGEVEGLSLAWSEGSECGVWQSWEVGMSGILDKDEKKKSGVLLECLECEDGGVDTVRFV